jgi:hypothetical protein
MSTLIKLDSTQITGVTSHDFTVNFNNFRLDRTKSYEVALVSLNIWYSWYNISSTFSNNVLRYHNATTWKTITIPNGSYGLDDINTYIKAQMADNGDDGTSITIQANYNTLRCDIIMDNSYQLDLQSSQGSFHELLGFDSQILDSGGLNVTVTGEGPVDITRGVNSISIGCSLTEAAYDNEIPSSAIYSFSPSVSSGELISIEPYNRIYLALNVRDQITRIRMQVLDNQNRDVDLNSESAVYVLHVRETK